jgi:hypothetical protein
MQQIDGLLKTCNIYMPGEMQEVMEACEKHGKTGVSALYLLSISKRNPNQYPIEQYRDILRGKLRVRRSAGH